MICDQIQDSLELYALCALEGGEAHLIEEHLATGCPSCSAALKRALDQNALVSSNVPLVEPPSRLRRRLGLAIQPSVAGNRQWLPWGLLAAAALLALVMGIGLQSRLHRQTEISRIESSERARLFRTLQIVRAPGTREVSFTDIKDPQLHGAVYVHQKLGLALVIDRLPDAPAGWKYESWLVPKNGNARPVESFYPDSSGRAVSVVPGPINVAEVASLAVSMEPLNSRPTKPTTLVFAAKV